MSLAWDECQMRRHRHVPMATQLEGGGTQASAQEWLTPKPGFLTSTLCCCPSNSRWTWAWFLREKDRVELFRSLTHVHDDRHSPCVHVTTGSAYPLSVCLPSKYIISQELGTSRFSTHMNRVGGRESCWEFFLSCFSPFFFLETVRGLERGVAAAGGSNCYNQSYFKAKN